MARILAISSHVCCGSVGLASIVPALHWLGHEVMPVPTVVLSNHPGYAHVAGEPLPASDVAAMLAALEANGWLQETTAVLSGYLPTPDHVAAVREAVESVRRANPAALFLCDPVLGDDDDGGLYLPEAVAVAVREQLLPLASLATPNCFELSWLSNQRVENAATARKAAAALAVPAVLATSIPEADNRLANVLVEGDAALACFVRRREAAPHGTGDLLAAMFLGNRLNGSSRAYCLGASVSAVDASVAASMGRNELPLSASGALWPNARVLPTVPL